MPTLFEFVRAEKSEVQAGNWQNGHISHSAFPLSKAKKKHLRFGPEYKWRVIRFRCLGHRCRVLVLLNEKKLVCRSTFAVDVKNDLAVLCSHEYHASHPGWHCHLCVEAHDNVTLGVFRSGQRRWPQAGARHCRTEYGVTQASALSHVAARYRFQAQGILL